MSEKNICISIYKTYQAVEQALGTLQKAGVDLQNVSIVGKGYQEKAHPIGFYRVEDRISYLGLQGAFWAGLFDLLHGAGFFWVPELGPLVAVGPVVALLVNGLEGVAIGGGFGVLGAALYAMGVPRGNIFEYEKVIGQEMLIFMVDGVRDDVEQACDLLLSETQRVVVHTA
ncbi:MAG: hypothetical protein WBS20_01205 [Lysobacterales bacterium]